LRRATCLNRPVVVFASWSVLVCAGTAHAAAPYGPFTPPSSPVPSVGFQSSVRTATTLRVTGGQLSAAVARGARVTVTVAAHAFPYPVQVAIIEPELTGLNRLLRSIGYPGYTVATGFGVVVSRQNGAVITGKFRKPLGIVVRGSRLGTSGEKVLDVTSPRSVEVLASKRTTHTASISIEKGADLLVLNHSKPSAT